MTGDELVYLVELNERLGIMGILGEPTKEQLSAALRCVPGAPRPRWDGMRLTYDPAPPPPRVFGVQRSLFERQK